MIPLYSSKQTGPIEGAFENPREGDSKVSYGVTCSVGSRVV